MFMATDREAPGYGDVRRRRRPLRIDAVGLQVK